MRVRRLRPLRLLPFRLLVIGVLVTACAAVTRLSPPGPAGPSAPAAVGAPASAPVADVLQPTWLRPLPARREGTAVAVAVQLLTQLPHATQLAAKPRVATVPAAGALVRFGWVYAGHRHARTLRTGRSGWALLHLRRVTRAVVVRASYPGAGPLAAAAAVPVRVAAPTVSRSQVRAALHRPRRSTTAVARRYAASAFVFPFLHPGQAQPPSSWSLDQGVDMFADGQACGSAAVLVAVGNGVVIQEGISGFGPTAPVLRMTSGPLAGRNVYYGHTGRVYLPVGATVHAGQPLAEIGCGQVGYSAAPHLEIGVGVPGGPPCCPAMHQTSAQMYRLLAAAY